MKLCMNYEIDRANMWVPYRHVLVCVKHNLIRRGLFFHPTILSHPYLQFPSSKRKRYNFVYLSPCPSSPSYHWFSYSLGACHRGFTVYLLFLIPMMFCWLIFPRYYDNYSVQTVGHEACQFCWLTFWTSFKLCSCLTWYLFVLNVSVGEKMNMGFGFITFWHEVYLSVCMNYEIMYELWNR